MQRFQFPSLETCVRSKAAPRPEEVRHKPLPALLCSNELKLAAELGDVKPCSAGRGHSSPEERKSIYIAHTRSMLFILHHRLFSPFSSQYCRLVFIAKPKRLGKQKGGDSRDELNTGWQFCVWQLFLFFFLVVEQV